MTVPRSCTECRVQLNAHVHDSSSVRRPMLKSIAAPAEDDDFGDWDVGGGAGQGEHRCSLNTSGCVTCGLVMHSRTQAAVTWSVLTQVLRNM